MAANLHHKGNILRFRIFIKEIGTRILQQRKVDVNECMECTLQKKYIRPIARVFQGVFSEDGHTNLSKAVLKPASSP